jgi:hypothetical protein
MNARALIPAAALAAALLSTSPALGAENLRLDARDAANAGGSVVNTAASLAAGQRYMAIVSGTVSIWSAEQWRSHDAEVCGAPESAPITPSSDATNGPTGWDADTVFGVPSGVFFNDFTCVPSQIPFHSLKQSSQGFQINTGAGFQHVEPFGGARSVPRADHTYVYDLTGSGQPAGFKFSDQPANDNYGVLKIQVLTAAECAAIQCQGPSASRSGDQTTTPSTTVDSTVFQLPRTCVSRRRITIHVRKLHGVKLVKATVTLGKKTFKVVTGKALLRSTIDLRGLPKGSYEISIKGRTSRGQILTAHRSYRTCTPKGRK